MTPENAIYIYHWEGIGAPGSGEQIMACVKHYAEALGLRGAAALLADGGKALVERGARGKPYLTGIPDIHFSLSHSGAYGACAVHSRPVGADIQVNADCDRKAIARRFFHADEYAYLEKRGFEPFFQVWAAKESYVKYTGAGIFGGLAQFAVADEDGLKTSVNGVELRHIDMGNKYKMCVCAEEILIYQLVTLGYN